jgi:hypothetical protein
MGTDFFMRQAIEIVRWKDVCLSILQLWEKMEGHTTFHLESKYQHSRAEDRDQKMGCHTTPHLEGNI